MNAEIITIGDEILIGQIVDTNSAWLSAKLGEIGICVNRITSLSDRPEAITSGLNEALSRADLVLTTGGLGPTRDDLTKRTLGEFFSMPLVRNEQVYAAVEELLAARDIAFNVLNQTQAWIPDGCSILPNHHGTAPGMWFERNDQVVVAMPGVPFEMKAMVETALLPRLQSHFSLKTNLHKTALIYGLAESVLAETIAPWEAALPPHLHLAYLPGLSGVRLRLSAYLREGVETQHEIDRQFEALEHPLAAYLIGYGDCSLESAVGSLLSERRQTLSTAESCTGGNITHRITRNPGASEYFSGGVVAYSNAVKTELLGVDPAVLARHGAVSRKVAEQMARGVKALTGSTYGIATTGIAGPGGGSEEKPVGTVWIALATPTGVVSEVRVFGTLRNENIERASSFGLNLLRLHLKGLR